MKETEKLDLILRALYEQEDQHGELIQLIKAKGVDVSVHEASRLADRLVSVGYVKSAPFRMGVDLIMESKGMEFVEGSSFSQEGHPIINNHNTFSAPNATQVNQLGSGQITFKQTNYNETKQVLERIKEVINSDNSVSELARREIFECVEEVEAGLTGGRNPKFAFRSLIELSSDIASIASFVGQLTGLMAVG